MPRYGWAVLGVVVFLMVAGPAASGRLVPQAWGVGMFAAGGGLGLLAGIGLAVAAVYAAMRRRPWARPAAIAAVGPLLAGLVLIAVLVLQPGPSALFNDATTDLRDPPVFAVGPARGAGYPADFVAAHRAAYPSLAPRRLRQPPDAAFDVVLRAAQQMPDWEIVHTDRTAGVVQAVARTRLFRYEDDVVIRIRPEGEGSLVDMRSRSRIGKGDRGANAARIAAFMAGLADR
jgi:uncharacterized protein (DUF1499 family)